MRQSLALSIVLVFLLAQSATALNSSHHQVAGGTVSSSSDAKDITMGGYMGMLQTVQI